jgi:hypothetical protein
MSEEAHVPSSGNPFVDPLLDESYADHATPSTVYVDRNAQLTLGPDGLIVYGSFSSHDTAVDLRRY